MNVFSTMPPPGRQFRLSSARPEAPARKVGVLLTSHGDIDDTDTELRAYVREAVMRNRGIPLPGWTRPAVDVIGWPLEKQNLLAQYAAIGPTHYRENSEKQADAVTEALRARGIDGKAYVGYNFVHPSIDEAVERMRQDGITDIVVFNQGAQDSVASMGESVEETEAALQARATPSAPGESGWRPHASAVLRYNDDPRFEDLLTERLLRDAQKAFPGAPPGDVLILMTSHGLPERLINMGDHAVKDMRELYGRVSKRLQAEGYQTAHGFLNDDFFPGAKWSEPEAQSVAQQLVDDVLARRAVAPKHVLLDGRMSFTVHHRATMFDANVEARKVLETPTGPPWARYPGAEVKLAPNFDDDPGFAGLIADLTVEALNGRAADLQTLQ
ncbi:MAG: hypothetical protein EB084_10230 [Proteobacteria bacterium]|nr:hypothetical protein [Pseudomonadota bacterium]